MTQYAEKSKQSKLICSLATCLSIQSTNSKNEEKLIDMYGVSDLKDYKELRGFSSPADYTST